MNGLDALFGAMGDRAQTRRQAPRIDRGLRRLAEDAGYVPPTRATRQAGPPVPSVSWAGHQLAVIVCTVLDQPGAAAHVERLAVTIGEDGRNDHRTSRRDLDIDGAQVFACMLHLAGHPESAQFWWQLAAGAGHRMAAYCLHLHHLARGESNEADHWLGELHTSLDPGDPVLGLVDRYAGFLHRNRPGPPTRRPALTAEVRRLAARDDAATGLVCRPEREIADRLQGSLRG